MSSEDLRYSFRRQASSSNDYGYYYREPSQATMRSSDSVHGHRDLRNARSSARAEAAAPVITNNYYGGMIYVSNETIQGNRYPDGNDFLRSQDYRPTPRLVEPRSPHPEYLGRSYEDYVAQNLQPDSNRRNHGYFPPRNIQPNLYSSRDEAFARGTQYLMPRPPVRAQGYLDDFHEDDRGRDAYQDRPSFRYDEENNPHYRSIDRRYRDGAVGLEGYPRATTPWQSAYVRSVSAELEEYHHSMEEYRHSMEAYRQSMEVYRQSMEAHRRSTTARRISNLSYGSDMDTLPLHRPTAVRRSANESSRSHPSGRLPPHRTNVRPRGDDLSSDSEVDRLPCRRNTHRRSVDGSSRSHSSRPRPPHRTNVHPREADLSSHSDVDRLLRRRNTDQRMANGSSRSHMSGRLSPRRTNSFRLIADLSSDSEVDAPLLRTTIVRPNIISRVGDESPEEQQNNETIVSAPISSVVSVRTAQQDVLHSADHQLGQSEPETYLQEVQEAQEASVSSNVEDRHVIETIRLHDVWHVGYEIANMSTRHKYDIRHKVFNSIEWKCRTQVPERQQYYQFWYHFSRCQEIEHQEDWCRHCIRQGKLTIGKRHKSNEHYFGMWYDHPSNPPLGRYSSFDPVWPSHVFTHKLPSVNQMFNMMYRRQPQSTGLPAISVTPPQMERVGSANERSKVRPGSYVRINRNSGRPIPRKAISHRFPRHRDSRLKASSDPYLVP